MTASQRRYQIYLHSNEWKNKREQRLKLDNYRCQFCFSKKQLTVHHTSYRRFGNEPLEHLITLCDQCHYTVHQNKNKGNHHVNY